MKTLNEYRRDEFLFEDHKCIVVIPDTPDKERHFAVKTEYFGAFPNAEEALLERGYHLLYIANDTRWCIESDTDRRHRFVLYCIEKYALRPGFVAVGMSCGGQIAVKHAAKYPEDIAVLYLDAPVLNYLSCPFHVGGTPSGMEKEYIAATGMTLSDMLNYREHPIDQVPALLSHDLPVILCCGDADQTVPYKENGKVLYEQYLSAGGRIKLILKPGCDHHPHGLADPGEIVDFITNNM